MDSNDVLLNQADAPSNSYDDTLELKRMVRAFATNEIASAQVCMDETGEFPYDCWHKWSELGMAGILISDDYGGSRTPRARTGRGSVTGTVFED